MNMTRFTQKDAPSYKEIYEYKSLRIIKYFVEGYFRWQATASAKADIMPYGYGAIPKDAVREMLRDIDESIKKLNLLRQDALEALKEDGKHE